DEKKTLEDYRAANVKVIAQAKLAQGGVYAVTFRPDGKLVAAAGSDGNVRLIDTENGHVVKQFAPAPVGEVTAEAAAPAAVARRPQPAAAGGETETLPNGSTLVSLSVEPADLKLAGRFDVAQMVVTGTLASGERIDVTRMVDTRVSADVAEVSRTGQV